MSVGGTLRPSAHVSFRRLRTLSARAVPLVKLAHILLGVRGASSLARLLLDMGDGMLGCNTLASSRSRSFSRGAEGGRAAPRWAQIAAIIVMEFGA
jgi:hypothetical protein